MTSTSKVKLRHRQVTIALLTILLVMLVLLGSILFGTYYFGSSTLNAADELILSIKAQGYPSSFDELQNWKPTPVNDNAADHILAALKIHAEIPDAEELLWEVYESMPLTDSSIILEGDAREKAHQLLTLIEPVVDKILAAAEIDECKFQVLYPESLDFELDPTSGYRKVASILLIAVYDRIASGDAEGAVEAIVAGMRLAKHLEDEPGVSTQMFRLTCQYRMRHGTMSLASTTELDEGSIDKLIEAFSDFDSRSAFERGLVGDRTWTFYAVDQFYHGKTDFGMGLEQESRDYFAQLPKTIRDFFVAREILQLNSWYEPVLPNIPEAWPQILQTSESTTQLEPTYYQLTVDILKPATHSFALSCGGAEAALRTAVTALAVEKYRVRNGNFPNSLEALVPEFFNSIPLDPFDGSPLRYKANVSGFEVYSVYANQKDDGAKCFRLDHADKYESDLVFRVDHANTIGAILKDPTVE